MGRLAQWMNERHGLGDLRRSLLDREVPSRLTWWHTLGSATLAAFLVQVVTGAVLATFYSPSPDHAYDSVRYIEGTVRAGAFVRGMHRWAASFMVVLVIAHMVRVFSMGAYKYPREANWTLGAVLFVLVMGFGFTGYLLPWDQKAYWATQVGTSMAGTMPVVGAALARLLRGGPELGAATLTRFYALHVLWLPLALGGLVALHLAMVVRQGIAPRTAVLDDEAPARTTAPGYGAYYRERYAASKRTGVRFWPDIVGKDVIVASVVVLAIAVLAATLGAGLEAPADATDTSYVPRPEWYFLPIFQLLTLVPGRFESVVAIGVPAALVVTLLALPFFDTRSRRNLRRRPFAAGALVVLLGGSTLLAGFSVRADIGRSRPEPGGVVLSSVQRAGRGLFAQQQCGSCHMVRGEGGDKGPDLSEVGLHRSGAWMHSFIEQPKRFHPDSSEMPSFGPPILSHQEIEELAQYLTTLRGKPGNPAPPDIHDTFPELAVPR